MWILANDVNYCIATLVAAVDINWNDFVGIAMVIAPLVLVNITIFVVVVLLTGTLIFTEAKAIGLCDWSGAHRWWRSRGYGRRW